MAYYNHALMLEFDNNIPILSHTRYSGLIYNILQERPKGVLHESIYVYR